MLHRVACLGLIGVALVTGACRSGARTPNELKAVVMAREYGEAWLLNRLNQHEDSAKVWVKARSLALELGITDPPAQTEWLEQEGRMASELKAKHGDKIQAHFLAAGSLMRAWIGLKTGADVAVASKEIQASATHLEACGIPADVWTPLITKVKDKPTAEDVRKLLETIESHLINAGTGKAAS
jgi:hypothetical protein